MGRKEKLMQWYDKKPVNQDRIGTFSVEFEGIKKYIQQIATMSMRALDIACGSGPYTFLLATICAKVDAVDISNNSIKILKQDIRFNSHIITPRVIDDAKQLPFPDNTFQLVACIGMLEYYRLEEKKVFLGEMHRVLNAGGWLILDIPLPNHPKTIEFTRMERSVGNDIFPEDMATIKSLLSEQMFILKKRKLAGFAQQFLAQRLD